ncbi:MAG: FKBP-type peptidyl-prolyl cis-trans isomerase [Bacteroidetes bacterium]|nr:FKBP-type peptidyl-prolyl cis-trans isomerase [Bacteroidota bacterium]
MNKLIIIFSLLLLTSSCKQKPTPPTNIMNEDSMKVHLENANQILVHKESGMIDEFVKRHAFAVERTGTGLRIGIYKHGKGKNSPIIHDEVVIACRVFLLDGTLCYEADSLKPFHFKIGEGRSSNGLEEGLMKMVEGDKAHLVVPMHLGYGLSGDGEKIPPAAALYYDVELLKVNIPFQN